MHRREGPKFPWGKVLGFLIPIALIIIVIIARSNAVDEGERRNRAMSRVIVTSVPTSAFCNRDFIGLDSTVQESIETGFEINRAAISESTPPEELAAKVSDASLEIAQVWANAAANAGDAPGQLLQSIAEVWERKASIATGDVAGQVGYMRSLATAYGELAYEFEKCGETKAYAYDLREEALELRQLANRLN